MQAEELNPFSFREFLRWKNQDPDLDQEQDQDLDQELTHSRVPVLQLHREQKKKNICYNCLSHSQQLFDVGVVAFDSGVRSVFFSEPSLEPQVK